MEPVIEGMHAIRKDLRHVKFSRVRRQGNRPTHLQGKYVLGIVDFIAWIEENPCFLEQALIHDELSFSHH